jgi:hypothetical protein
MEELESKQKRKVYGMKIQHCFYGISGETDQNMIGIKDNVDSWNEMSKFHCI